MEFTQANARSLKAPPGKTDHKVFDDAMPGFGIRFRNGGNGNYIVQYSLNGRQSRIGLGKVSQVALADAKKEARQLFADIARGVDPALERSKAAALVATTFGSKIAPFLAWLEKQNRAPSYIADNKRSLDERFAALHSLGFNEIDRAMIAGRLSEIAETNGERAAGNCRAHIHKYFNWAIEEGLAERNPAAGTKKRSSTRRTRVLTPDELVRIWNASGEGDYGRIIKLLILTAARIDVIGSLRTSEVQLDANDEPKLDRLIDVPAQRNKNGERFLIPLSRRAQAILRSVPARGNAEFVFGTGNGGFSGWHQSKKRLDERLGQGFEPWVHHDFRRTFESLGIESAKIVPWVADVCLHHVGEHKKGIKRTYNHAQYIDEKRDALEKWADYIDGLLNKTPKLAVVA
jgi:integrase